MLRLQSDIAIYSIGLFPFLQHAQQSLKPALLTLYDFYTRMDQTALSSPLFGLVLGLLPGLEEEGNEFFDRFGSPS
jgi:hypothetical protein